MNWFLILKLVKSKYRHSVLQQRKSLSDQEHLALSQAIQENFLQSISLSGIKNIALYMPANNEVSLDLLNKEISIYNKISIPVVKPNKQLQFIKPKTDCEFTLNQFNILEPTEGIEVEVNSHDLIIVPSVGVDKNGFRLGYGGGYYDRVFADHQSSLKKPLLIGLLFSFQKINDAFGESHDMKFDHVFTELGEERF
ncbi:MAG: 5-formyltetrahydrofolate cyclo-ligase [Proteobacteria bacterium]|nr:5-formyltetrahydrofolate cyclo-ligase [Pseudomonadota bacterium]